MNFRRFKHFIAVVETGSLSAAAKRVNLSQPALSKSIAKLEEELGMRLFDRLGSLELTELGRQVLKRVQVFVGAGDDLRHDLLLLRGGDVGELEVGCGPIMAESLLGPAVARLLEVEPRLHVSTHIGAVQALEPMLQRRQLDLMLGDLSQLKHPGDYELMRFSPAPIIWFVRPGHPLTGRLEVSTEEFFSYPIVTPTLSDWASAWFDRVVPESMRPFRPAFECSHYPSLLEVVGRTDSICGGTGASVARELRSGMIELLRFAEPTPFAEPVPHLQAGAVFLKDRSLSPPAAMLLREIAAKVDHFRSTFSSGPITDEVVHG